MEEDRNSLLYWYPKIQTLNIPLPTTEIVKVKYDWEYFIGFVDGENNLEPYIEEIREKANVIGYPLFARTDELSAKHSWKNSCYVEREEDFLPHLCRITEESFMADILGLPINAIVLREYVPLDSTFTAFWGELPIARERRYFVKDGEVLCHHPYWIEDAIINPSIPDWKEALMKLNTETAKELILLSNLAQRVADEFDGYWSVDFACSKEGTWYLIDMALGADSWHPQCDKIPTMFKGKEEKQERGAIAKLGKL